MNRTVTATKVSATGIVSRVESLDWAQIVSDLDAYGCAAAKGVLLPEQCRALAALYDQDGLFRSRIVMSRHGFGRGEYKYWAHPLPEAVATLRCALYPHLAEVANRWNQTMQIDVRYPADHTEYLEQCHEVGGSSRRRFSSNTARETSIACTRTCTAISCSHCRSLSSCRFPARISPGASSC